MLIILQIQNIQICLLLTLEQICLLNGTLVLVLRLLKRMIMTMTKEFTMVKSVERALKQTYQPVQMILISR